MKKSFFILIGMLSVLTAFADMNQRQEIYPADTGARTSATLNTVLGLIKTTDKATVVLTEAWTITNNVTVPSYVDLKMLYGSSFAIDNGSTVTVTDVKFDAGPYVIATGAGLMTGDADFLYRWPVWGSTGLVDIGNGGLSSEWIEALDLVFAGGTTQTFDNVFITNLIAKVGVITNLTVDVMRVEGPMTMGSIADLIYGAGSESTFQAFSTNYYQTNSLVVHEDGSTNTFEAGAVINGVGWTNAVQAAQVTADLTRLENPYSFKANMGGAAQSIAVNTDVKISMTNEVWDVGDGYTPATARYVPPANGKYMFGYHLYTDGDETPETSWAKIFTNGVVDSQQGEQGQVTSDDDLRMCVISIIDLTTNDYVEAYAHSSEDTGTTPIVPATYETFWFGHYIGE